MGRLTHGHCQGRRVSLTYSSWRAMKARCLNPGHAFYYLYGGRGIGVCLRWLWDFEAFLEDMGERPIRFHSLDRIDPDQWYFRENCRWATAREQWENLRTIIPAEEIDWEF